MLTIREALKKYDAEVLRFFLLRPHYRSQIAFTETLIVEARTALSRLYTAMRDSEADALPLDWDEAYARRFHDAMNDDFNTPVALAALFDSRVKSSKQVVASGSATARARCNTRNIAARASAISAGSDEERRNRNADLVGRPREERTKLCRS